MHCLCIVLFYVFNNIFSSSSGILENAAPIQTPSGSSEQLNSQISKYLEDQASLEEIQNRVEDFIAVNELENQFDTNMTEEGLLITIRDSVLFDSGKADIKTEYLSIADELSEVLQLNPPRNVIVTGHTDNVPMNTPEFRSNWELSVMRAVNFLKILMDSNGQLESKHFSAKGFGEYNPIDTNDTAEGRAKNRRVEVLIQPLVLEDGTEINIID